MRKGVVIAGYYGANNTGDEAILTGMLHVLRSQGITDITVLSRNPKQTAQLHGVKSIYIGRRFDGLGKIYKAFTGLFQKGSALLAKQSYYSFTCRYSGCLLCSRDRTFKN